LNNDNTGKNAVTFFAHGFRSHIIIHEHDFIAMRSKNETSGICPSYGLRYWEKSSKLPNNIVI
jgi:hypothetical protein